MAITPRTVLSRPVNLLMFALGVLGVGGLIGLLVSAGERASAKKAAQAGWTKVAPEDLDAGRESSDALGSSNKLDRTPTTNLQIDYTCRPAEPEPGWTEEQWLRHLDCLEARGEPTEALLDETRAAIDAVGLTADLAVLEADYLEILGTYQEHVAYLEGVVEELGVVDGRLVHRLSRALTWKAERDDFERIRRLQLLSRTLMADDCEVIQTDIWVRYLMAEEFAQQPSPAAYRGARDAIDTYLDQGCHEQRHTGRWDALAEVVGVGIVAEATNGHDGHSNLIRQVAESFDIQQLDAFCRQAAPETSGLRASCKKRVGDELYLSKD